MPPSRPFEKARGGSPALIEMETYRYRGHSMSDPALYRSKEEVDDIKTNRDPLTLLKERLTLQYSLNEDELKAMDKKVKSQVLEAVTFAKESAFPDEAELYTDVLRDQKEEEV